MAQSSFFQITHRDERTRARLGIVRTSHGTFETPTFMPVGTQGTVKGISSAELKSVEAPIILSNTYHLYLRPGTDVIRQAGGLHRFMNWSGPLLTDSGGFQIFSLSTLNKIEPEGVHFQSHIDGSRHFLTPEKVIGIQNILGSDILMPLDECVKYEADKKYVEESLALTERWAGQSLKAWKLAEERSSYGYPNILFGIVQGGMYKDLRRRAVENLAAMDFPGYSIGGLSVGEPTNLMYEMLDVTAPILPELKPRYLMGVGLPHDLFEAVSQGVDMFDCVVPTRNGRNATVFTTKGKLLLRNQPYARDFRPIDEDCPCYTCRTYSRAYLRHLFNAEEHLGGRLASLHNLAFFIQLLKSMRRAIAENRFDQYRREFERNFPPEEAE